MGVQLDSIAISNIFGFVNDEYEPHYETINSLMLVNKNFCAVIGHELNVHNPDRFVASIVREYFDDFCPSDEINETMLAWIGGHKNYVVQNDDNRMLTIIKKALQYYIELCDEIELVKPQHENLESNIKHRESASYFAAFIRRLAGLLSFEYPDGRLVAEDIILGKRSFSFSMLPGLRIGKFMLQLILKFIIGPKWTLKLMYKIIGITWEANKHPYVWSYHQTPNYRDIIKKIEFDADYPFNWIQRNTVELIREDPELMKGYSVYYSYFFDIFSPTTDIFGDELNAVEIMNNFAPQSAKLWVLLGRRDISTKLSAEQVMHHILIDKFEVGHSSYKHIKNVIPEFTPSFITKITDLKDKWGQSWIDGRAIRYIVLDWAKIPGNAELIDFDVIPFRTLPCFNYKRIKSSGKFTKAMDYLWWSIVNNEEHIGRTRKIAVSFDIKRDQIIEWVSKRNWKLAYQYMDRIDRIYDMTINDEYEY